MSEPPASDDRVRTAEVVAALSLATDLGSGLPLEHGLQSTAVAMRLCDALAVDDETAAQAYYTCLLFYVGCTAMARSASALFGNDTAFTTYAYPARFGSRPQMIRGMLRAVAPPEGSAGVRAAQLARGLPKLATELKGVVATTCETAQMLIAGLGLPASVSSMFRYESERWDGAGQPGKVAGDAIPIAVRIVHVARDASLHRMLGGEQHAAQVIRQRGGHAFDPAIASLLADKPGEILAANEASSVWDHALAGEPRPHRFLEGDEIDRALRTMGNFADLVTPFHVGHSTGVAEVVTAAAHHLGFDPDRVSQLRRAALVHDLGRVAVPVRVWEQRTPLAPHDWEQIRLHPYVGDRVLARSPALAKLSRIASFHHERLDGSGYHRGASGGGLIREARLLATADAYHAMTEPRPHRPARTPDAITTILGDEARSGQLDADAVIAVVEGAGQRAPRLERPAGLTAREVEVVSLLARGLQTKQIARALGISAKTADRHVQNAYGKISVSTRAGAALFAMEHGLVTWGEVPIGDERTPT